MLLCYIVVAVDIRYNIAFPLWIATEGTGAETGTIVSHQWFGADNGQGPLKRAVFQDQTHQVTHKL